MAINFPTSPQLNEEYTLGNKTWVWNGYAWDLLPAASVPVTSVQLTGGSGTQGTLTWNNTSQTVNLVMNDFVTQQIGEELYVPLVKNITQNTITNGTPVIISGGDGEYLFIQPADSTQQDHQTKFLGVVTQDIETNAIGRVTYYGYVRDVNTTGYSIGDRLFVDPNNPGTLINQKPSSPYHSIFAGSVHSVGNSGVILVRPAFIQEAHDVSYNNQNSLLIASSVQAAIDELQNTKASTSLLNTDIRLYATTASSDIGGYYKLVTSQEDPSYNTTPIDVSTPIITTTDQLVASLASPVGLFSGDPGTISIPTIGNIAKIAGNSNTYSSFYFKVYKRTSTGTETLLATSNTTPAINPEALDTYSQFSTTALLTSGPWTITDRIVIKYYANAEAGTSSQYTFQFGGSTPVYTVFRVPVTVTANINSTNIIISTENFNNILSPTDDNLQAALETLDNHTHNYLPLSGGILSGHLNAKTVSITQHTISANTSTTHLDFTDYQNFYITLSTNTQFTVQGLANRIGCSGILIIKQDATGGHQFTKATEMKTPVGGASIVQVTTANSLSTLSYYIVDSSTILVNYIGDFA